MSIYCLKPLITSAFDLQDKDFKVKIAPKKNELNISVVDRLRNETGEHYSIRKQGSCPLWQCFDKNGLVLTIGSEYGNKIDFTIKVQTSMTAQICRAVNKVRLSPHGSFLCR